MGTPIAILSALLLQGEEAPAEAPPPSLFGGNFLVPMLLILGIFYVVLILPEKKKQKQRQALLDGLKKGDRVMTSSGMLGSVAQIQGDEVTLQVADGVRIKFTRSAVQTILVDEKQAKADAKTS